MIVGAIFEIIALIVIIFVFIMGIVSIYYWIKRERNHEYQEFLRIKREAKESIDELEQSIDKHKA